MILFVAIAIGGYAREWQKGSEEELTSRPWHVSSGDYANSLLKAA